jgi:hypothetical protein
MEVSRLKEMHRKFTAAQIGAEIGRTKSGVLKKIASLGLQTRIDDVNEHWTDEVLTALKTLGHTMTAKQFMVKYGTLRDSTYYHAKKYQIKFSPDLVWTKDDVEVIRRVGNATEASKILCRDRDAVVRKAKKEGIVLTGAKPKSPSASRKPAIHAVKQPEKKKYAVQETCKIEWCSQCGSPVSDWAGHTARIGCRRIA